MKLLNAAACGLLAATVLAAAAPQAQAFTNLNNLFRFEFYEGGSKIIGTDTHGHYNDFRHNSDYYVTRGYTDEHEFTNCREYRVNGDRQIRCVGTNRSPSSVPGR